MVIISQVISPQQVFISAITMQGTGLDAGVSEVQSWSLESSISNAGSKYYVIISLRSVSSLLLVANTDQVPIM